MCVDDCTHLVEARYGSGFLVWKVCGLCATLCVLPRPVRRFPSGLRGPRYDDSEFETRRRVGGSDTGCSWSVLLAYRLAAERSMARMRLFKLWCLRQSHRLRRCQLWLHRCPGLGSCVLRLQRSRLMAERLMPGMRLFRLRRLRRYQGLCRCRFGLPRCSSQGLCVLWLRWFWTPAATARCARTWASFSSLCSDVRLAFPPGRLHADGDSGEKKSVAGDAVAQLDRHAALLGAELGPRTEEGAAVSRAI
mmetsp:Transcript_6442/g.19498  ORF Transcript_6442/g.19498 Transcript_6442/m.19498 type:complete len:249 (+) Transcript_6442:56-802(+)